MALPVNQRLKILLEANNITAKALADELGVPHKTIYNYINGDTEIKASLLERVFNHFPNTNPAWILAGKGEIFLDYDQKGNTAHLLQEPSPAYNQDCTEKLDLLHRARVTERYHAALRACEIEDKELTLYNWKHTGTIAAYRSGVDMLSIMRQCRHKDPKQTMQYMQSIGLMLEFDLKDAEW